MTRILIVDEVRLRADLMAAVLEREENLRVVRTTSYPAEARDAVEDCDVMLISTGLPENGTLSLIVQAQERNPSLRVLVVGLLNVPQLILQHVEAGACGYVLREDSVETLIEAVHAACQGQALVSPDMAAALMARIVELFHLAQRPGFAIGEPVDLTNRQEEILQLIVDGMKNREIADRLFINIGTVKNHVHNILDKIGVGSRDEAAAYFRALNPQVA